MCMWMCKELSAQQAVKAIPPIPTGSTRSHWILQILPDLSDPVSPDPLDPVGSTPPCLPRPIQKLIVLAHCACMPFHARNPAALNVAILVWQEVRNARKQTEGLPLVQVIPNQA